MSQSVSNISSFNSICPILTSYDIDATEAFYREKLHFQTNAKYPNYLIMVRENLMLHFTLTEGNPDETMTQCYVYVDNVQPIYEECKAAAIVHPNGDLQNKPYRMRDFSMRDADGNVIIFGQRLENPTEVIPRMDE